VFFKASSLVCFNWLWLRSCLPSISCHRKELDSAPNSDFTPYTNKPDKETSSALEVYLCGSFSYHGALSKYILVWILMRNEYYDSAFFFVQTISYKRKPCHVKASIPVIIFRIFISLYYQRLQLFWVKVLALLLRKAIRNELTPELSLLVFMMK